MKRLSLCPMTLREARAFVAQHHRHHNPPQGGLFAIGAEVSGEVVGVAIVGRPVARLLAADAFAAEVTRLCVLDEPNACSLLYAACWRAWRAMGGKRLITYTLADESGASLRGAGWSLIGEAGGGKWSRRDRPRVDLHPLQVKLRWEGDYD